MLFIVILMAFSLCLASSFGNTRYDDCMNTTHKAINLQLARINSPIGKLLLVTKGEQLFALDFEDYESRMLSLLKARFGTLSLLLETPVKMCTGLQPDLNVRLAAYFAGDYHSLAEIPLNPGGTPFQRRVWSALQAIPVGTTMTYGMLATRLGNPSASRAVGMANSRNPIAIALPCHRVVGANHQLTGYAGGLERKKWLLKHEGVILGEAAQQIALPLFATGGSG